MNMKYSYNIKISFFLLGLKYADGSEPISTQKGVSWV